MRKLNWKAKLLSLRAADLSKVEELNNSDNHGKIAGNALILLGRIQMADEMLLAYGVEVKATTPILKLAS